MENMKVRAKLSKKKKRKKRFYSIYGFRRKFKLWALRESREVEFQL